MSQTSDIFEKHYQDYCTQIAQLDLLKIKDKLGLEHEKDRLHLRFADKLYEVSGAGIKDANGNRPNYAICVVLFKYILLCPDPAPYQTDWITISEFKHTGQFTNANFFASETEGLLQKSFSGRVDVFFEACKKMGGKSGEMDMPYDLAMEIDMLPRISLLILFNDKDKEFPAVCKVLFQKHAQYYLDPESMIIGTSIIAKNLVYLAES